MAAVMRVFHGHIWGITPDFVVEQLDAIALLWRVEMAGTAMDAEWPSIAEHVAPRAVETFMPFMNAHYVYALARDGRADEVEAALASVRVRSEATTRKQSASGRRWDARWSRLPAAFGAGDRAGAAAWLDPVMPMMTAIGGSDAQDDLFRQTYLRGLQAAGRHSDAAAYFERMTAGKARTPLDRALAG